MTGTLGPLLFSAALTVVAAVYLVMAMRKRDRITEGMEWPTTVGTVSSAKIEEFIDSSDREFGRTRMFRAKVAVDYAIDGPEYRVYPYKESEFAASIPSFVESRLRPYPVGSRVVVHVNPVDHARSMVDPRAMLRYANAEIAAMLVIGLGGFAWLYVAVRQLNAG